MSLQLTKLGVHCITNPEEGRPPFLSAASGTVWAGGTLYSVGDDQAALARFTLRPEEVQAALRNGADCDILAPGQAQRIIPGVLPLDMLERCEAKPDFEALTMVTRQHIESLRDREVRSEMLRRFPYGLLIIAGSGGMSWGGTRRSIGVVYSLDQHGNAVGLAAKISLEGLHEFLEQHVLGELNIEGICIHGAEVILAQRGNSIDKQGKPGENMLIRLSLVEVLRSLYTDLEINQLELREITPYNDSLGVVTAQHEGWDYQVKLDFTDLDSVAGDPERRLIFTAAAEGVDGPFKGKIVGSAIGIIDGSGKVVRLEHLADTSVKLEGVNGFYNPTLGCVDFLAVADADDPDVPAPLYAGRFK